MLCSLRSALWGVETMQRGQLEVTGRSRRPAEPAKVSGRTALRLATLQMNVWLK